MTWGPTFLLLLYSKGIEIKKEIDIEEVKILISTSPTYIKPLAEDLDPTSPLPTKYHVYHLAFHTPGFVPVTLRANLMLLP